jgi:hypothetical protein
MSDQPISPGPCFTNAGKMAERCGLPVSRRDRRHRSGRRSDADRHGVLRWAR